MSSYLKITCLRRCNFQLNNMNSLLLKMLVMNTLREMEAMGRLREMEVMEKLRERDMQVWEEEMMC